MSILNSLPKTLLSWITTLDPSIHVWLVGGAVRDSFLDRTTVDFDFALTGNALELARQAADQLECDVFTLDHDRGAARVLLDATGPARRVLDFAALRGSSIEDDLRARDFSINAMAIDLRQPERLIDPCQGLSDLHAGIIKVCSPGSLASDAIRALRAIRLASDLEFKIDGDTQQLIREAVPHLDEISRERIRDELFRVLSVGEPGIPLRLMRHFEFDLTVFGTESSDLVAERITMVGRELSRILAALSPNYDPETAGSASLGLLAWQLGRYRSGLHNYLQTELSPFRRCRELAYLSMLEWLHQENTQVKADDSRSDRPISRNLRLSQAELRWVGDYLAGMEQVKNLESTPLGVFRFFQASGEAGVACGLAHLADIMAREGSGVQPAIWAEQVEKVRQLLEAWFDRRGMLIDPIPILNGDELMQELGLSPGPVIGRILELLREQQVAGQIQNRPQAVEAAREIYRRLE